jgi:PLP dependent protein
MNDINNPLCEVAQNLENVTEKIKISLSAANRPPDATTLVAVSKLQSVDKIEVALKNGQRSFGENRIQEASQKWPSLKRNYSSVKLHLIGPLQTNKVKEAVSLFDVIETVDRPKLASEIKKQLIKQDIEITCYVQVNTGEESQKAGIFPSETFDFVKYCEQNIGLRIHGLMCIPPMDEEPALHFALLAKIADTLDLTTLSMGMSNDFETAIEYGATHVRVGSGVFGERQINK